MENNSPPNAPAPLPVTVTTEDRPQRRHSAEVSTIAEKMVAEKCDHLVAEPRIAESVRVAVHHRGWRVRKHKTADGILLIWTNIRPANRPRHRA